jgi:hypothetical protein
MRTYVRMTVNGSSAACVWRTRFTGREGARELRAPTTVAQLSGKGVVQGQERTDGYRSAATGCRGRPQGSSLNASACSARYAANAKPANLPIASRASVSFLIRVGLSTMSGRR